MKKILIILLILMGCSSKLYKVIEPCEQSEIQPKNYEVLLEFINDLIANHDNYREFLMNSKVVNCEYFMNKVVLYDENKIRYTTDIDTFQRFGQPWAQKKVTELFFNNVDTDSVNCP
jgi:hypothetical protein